MKSVESEEGRSESCFAAGSGGSVLLLLCESAAFRAAAGCVISAETRRWDRASLEIRECDTAGSTGSSVSGPLGLLGKVQNQVRPSHRLTNRGRSLSCRVQTPQCHAAIKNTWTGTVATGRHENELYTQRPHHGWLEKLLPLAVAAVVVATHLFFQRDPTSCRAKLLPIPISINVAGIPSAQLMNRMFGWGGLEFGGWGAAEGVIGLQHTCRWPLN